MRYVVGDVKEKEVVIISTLIKSRHSESIFVGSDNTRITFPGGITTRNHAKASIRVLL